MKRTFSTRIRIGGMMLLLILSLSCQAGGLNLTPTPEGSPETPGPPEPPHPNQATLFSIEYGVPGLAKIYAEAGVKAVKLQPVFGIWGNIEPQPGQFNWSVTDALVAEYQQAGFTHIQLLITAESPWAATRPPSLGDKGDSFPQEIYLDDYAAFVASFVERYDADGVDDAPGLLYPVNHFGIEREFTGYWPSGDAEDYVRLLRIAYPEIKKANPNAQVILVALLLSDVFNGLPTPEEVDHRLSSPPLLGYSLDAMQTVLAACDAYDMVDFHSLGDYTEIPQTTAWLREKLTDLGCGEKPIWIGDAFSMSALTGYNDSFGWQDYNPIYPANAENVDEVVALLEAAADLASTDHGIATTWLQAQMARGLVKKLAVSAGERLDGINIGNLEDWSAGSATAINIGLVRSAGTSIFMGMIDRTISNQQAGTPYHLTDPVTRIRTPGAPRPAYLALSQFMTLVGDYSTVSRCPAMPAGVWCYRFSTPQETVYLLWYDSGELVFPGEKAPETAYHLAIEGDQAAVWRTPITAESIQPEYIYTNNGSLNLSLNETPLFVVTP